MDKVKDMDNSFNHGITMAERKNIIVSGVKKIDSFDSEEFLLDTVMGFLAIKGQNLQMINLDVDKGHVSIKGKVFEMEYLDENSKDKAKGFFGKLFKWH